MPDAEQTCGYCGALVHKVNDLLARAARRVVAMGGVVEEVRGGAATRLLEVGGVGAFLR
jgi:hypothetical protein